MIRQQFKEGADFIKIYETGHDTCAMASFRRLTSTREAELGPRCRKPRGWASGSRSTPPANRGHYMRRGRGSRPSIMPINLSDETMRIMREKRIFAVPTFTIIEYFAEHAGSPAQAVAANIRCWNFTRRSFASNWRLEFRLPWDPTWGRFRTARRPANLC